MLHLIICLNNNKLILLNSFDINFYFNIFYSNSCGKAKSWTKKQQQLVSSLYYSDTSSTSKTSEDVSSLFWIQSTLELGETNSLHIRFFLLILTNMGLKLSNVFLVNTFLLCLFMLTRNSSAFYLPGIAPVLYCKRGDHINSNVKCEVKFI